MNDPIAVELALCLDATRVAFAQRRMHPGQDDGCSDCQMMMRGADVLAAFKADDYAIDPRLRLLSPEEVKDILDLISQLYGEEDEPIVTFRFRADYLARFERVRQVLGR
jgi:hypothetical protein